MRLVRDSVALSLFVSLLAACGDSGSSGGTDALVMVVVDSGATDSRAGDARAADGPTAGDAGVSSPDGAVSSADGAVSPSDGAQPDGMALASDAAVVDTRPSPDVGPDLPGCTSTCTTAGTFCASDDAVVTCSASGACLMSSAPMTCAGAKTCQGAAGSASCQCPAAAMRAGAGCATDGALACADNVVLRCSADPAGSGCLIWQAATDCTGGAVSCASMGAMPNCGCPARSGSDVYVDPVGGNDTGTGPSAPTGAAAPAACRFKTVTKALAALGGPGKVIVTSAAAVRLDGETFPLRIPNGVTVTTNAPTDPTLATLVGKGAVNPALVVVEGNGSLSGFTIDAAGADTTAVACTAGAVTLENVVAKSTGRKGVGFAIGGSGAGACAPILRRLRAEGFDYGMTIDTGATQQLALEGSTFTANSFGAQISRGRVDVRGSVFTGNVANKDSRGWPISGDGLVVRTANAVVTADAGSRFDQNGRDGLLVVDSNLTGTGFHARKNAILGVNVRGGVVKMHGVQLVDNGDIGLRVTGGDVLIDDGSLLANNGASAFLFEIGKMQVGSPQGALVELVHNGYGYGWPLYGANIEPESSKAELTIMRTVMRENKHFGAKVSLKHAGNKVRITDSDIHSNGNGGILFMAVVAGAEFVADNVRIFKNGTGGQSGRGVHYIADDGDVLGATVRDSVIRDNGDVGVLVEPVKFKVRTTLERNQIYGNNTTANRSAGGLLFTVPTTIGSIVGNRVYGNRGDQIGFAVAAEGGGAWTLGDASACATPASVNQIGCYGSGAVGVRAAAGVTVNAPGISWQGAAPAAGVDFAGTVNAAPACAAAALTCP